MTVLKAKSGEIIILTYDSENSYFKGKIFSETAQGVITLGLAGKKQAQAQK